MQCAGLSGVMAEKVTEKTVFQKIPDQKPLRSRDEQSDFVIILALEVFSHFRKPDIAFLIQDDLCGVTARMGQFIVS